MFKRIWERFQQWYSQRKERKAIRRMADAIKGLEVSHDFNIRVRPDRLERVMRTARGKQPEKVYTIVAGHCRIEAAKHLLRDGNDN